MLIDPSFSPTSTTVYFMFLPSLSWLGKSLNICCQLFCLSNFILLPCAVPFASNCTYVSAGTSTSPLSFASCQSFLTLKWVYGVMVAFESSTKLLMFSSFPSCAFLNDVIVALKRRWSSSVFGRKLNSLLNDPPKSCGSLVSLIRGARLSCTEIVCFVWSYVATTLSTTWFLLSRTRMLDGSTLRRGSIVSEKDSGQSNPADQDVPNFQVRL